MTQDELKKLVTEAFKEGQVIGIELACDAICERIQEFKKKLIEATGSKAHE